DAPICKHGDAASLLDQVGGRFDLLIFDHQDPRLEAELPNDLRVTHIAPASRAGMQVLEDNEAFASRRYGTQRGGVYLLRPDQHVAARWRAPSVRDVTSALTRAQGCR
ncbi:MAG: FAD-dependent oxidoreductase, partial [Burkholderiaceae bacterium]